MVDQGVRYFMPFTFLLNLYPILSYNETPNFTTHIYGNLSFYYIEDYLLKFERNIQTRILFSVKNEVNIQ